MRYLVSRQSFETFQAFIFSLFPTCSPQARSFVGLEFAGDGLVSNTSVHWLHFWFTTIESENNVT